MEMIRYYESPAGRLVMTADGEYLTGLRFDDGREQRPETPEGACEDSIPAVLRETERWLDVYFSGRDPGFTPPLLVNGTAFWRVVWEILTEIPYGRTVTYGEIAARAAARMNVARMSAQAVGGAIGHNPIALIIPCHRVIGSDGSMTGYAGGTDRKILLLRMEKAGLFQNGPVQNVTSG